MEETIDGISQKEDALLCLKRKAVRDSGPDLVKAISLTF